MTGSTSAGAPQCIYKTHGNTIAIIIIIFLENFLKYMRAGDQKHIILLEWPYMRLKFTRTYDAACSVLQGALFMVGFYVRPSVSCIQPYDVAVLSDHM